ncbi:hypothetical protein D3C85_1732500 [compost metagenome]
MPRRVLRITVSRHSIRLMLTHSTRISCGSTPAPPMRSTSLPSGEGMTMGEGPQMASAMFWMMMPKPMVLITQARPPWPMNGRMAA